MIYYNSNTINDWNFGDDNIIKVYKHGAVCYYKITSGDTPTPVQEPCFAVVDDITQYSDTEFEDVYDKATEKWYKLNNLSQYEEYGLYGSGRNITYYDGKLTIDDGYEYQYSGASWNNVGEVSGSSRLPQGYTEVEYAENTTQAYINLDVYVTKSNFEVGYVIDGNLSGVRWGYVHQNVANGAWVTNEDGLAFMGRFSTNGRYDLKISAYTSSTQNTIIYNNSGVQINGTTLTKSLSLTTTDNIETIPLYFFARYDFYKKSLEYGSCKFKSFYLKNNGTLVRDLVPCKRDSDSMVGMYDLVNDMFYYPPNYTSYQLVAGPIATGTTVYPLYYDVIQDPPNNLSFSSMTEAESYECPWVGMVATIDGVPYVFSGDSTSGYEWVLNPYSLPDVPFVLNYNAKNYDATTHSIPQTSGQTKEVDAICNYNPNNIIDNSSNGYVSVTGNTRLTISGGTTSLARSNNQTGCTMTIVSKARTDNVNESYSIITNRGSYSDMNWMWRYPANGIFLHGSSSYNKVTYYTPTSASPITASVRVSWDGSVKQQINDWTNNGSYSGAFQYGSTSNSGALFCDYLKENAEFWKGDFYWVYMSHEVLTDEQIQQVIDYNENL